MKKRRAVIWTAGHSNRSIENFFTLIEEHKIEVLIDIRSFPTSKIKHFKEEEMKRWLPEHEIEYVWLGKELGGYRRGGYEAHMKTELFREGVEKRLELARQKRVCIMCMERNPKCCHRRFLTAYLERKRVEVIHILEKGQVGLMKFKDIISEKQPLDLRTTVMRGENVHVHEFQDMMRRIYFHRDSERGAIRTFDWLVEEVEELEEALKKKSAKAMEDEFADVLAWLASLANVVNVDLEKAALRTPVIVFRKCGQTSCRCSLCARA